jgi:hypothetical protein
VPAVSSRGDNCHNGVKPQLKGAGGYGRLALKGDLRMPGIIDRLLVLACCAALLVGAADEIGAVVAVLAAITVSALNGYTGSRLFPAVSILLYTASERSLARTLPVPAPGLL